MEEKGLERWNFSQLNSNQLKYVLGNREKGQISNKTGDTEIVFSSGQRSWYTKRVSESNDHLKQKMCPLSLGPSLQNTQKATGHVLLLLVAPARPAVHPVRSLEAGQCSKPHAGLGKQIPSIIACSQVGHLPFFYQGLPNDIL